MNIKINTSKKYDVNISSNINDLVTVFDKSNGNKILLLIDENIEKFYFNSLIKFSFFPKENVYKFIILSGEKNKSFDIYNRIICFLIENNFSRSDVIVALGGGVVTDIAGFTASTFMRGLKLIYVPTTLLSMVDASIGGKNGLNFGNNKNYIGTFYQPDYVFICTEFLKTLPKSEYLSGYGEIIKYSFIDNIDLSFSNDESLINIIAKCVEIKGRIVSKDEFDFNERKILNLGHTFGHAIEKLSEFSISHGECVVKGIKIALDISKKLYNFDDKTYLECLRRLKIMGHNINSPYSKNEILECIKLDKKHIKDKIDILLIDKNYKAKIERLSFNEIGELL